MKANRWRKRYQGNKDQEKALKGVFGFPSKSESHSVVSDSLWSHGLCMNSPGQTAGVGSLSLLQGIFPTQGSNPGFLHCRWILYQLSFKGSPRILEWLDYPFSRGSSQPRNRTGISCIASVFFTNWAIRKAQLTFKLVEGSYRTRDQNCVPCIGR